jgi:hypothetical protein
MNVGKFHSAVSDHANGAAGAGFVLVIVAVYVGLVAARNQFGPMLSALGTDLQDNGSQIGFLKWAVAIVVLNYLTSMSVLAPYRGLIWTAAIIGGLLQIQSRNPDLLASVGKLFSTPWTFTPVTADNETNHGA